jgi:hypothetical protein
MGSADVIRSPGKPAEDGFIRVSRKKCDVGAVQSSEDTKIAKKSRTLTYKVCDNSSLPVVSKQITTKVLCVKGFSPPTSLCMNLKIP